MEAATAGCVGRGSRHLINTVGLSPSLDIPDMDLRFLHPCTGLIVGGTGSGKTYLVKQLIEHREDMFDVTFTDIIYYYTEWQCLFDDLATSHHVEFRQELPLLQDHPRGSPKLLIVDDFLSELKNHQKEFLEFYIKGSHHRNLSVFFLSQSLFPDGLRQISLNTHYILLFKTSRDLAQIRTFCMQVNPQHWRALLEAYEDATQQGHTYILFDFKPNQLDHLRIRTKILPHESPVVYIPRKQYKSDMEVPLEISRR